MSQAHETVTVHTTRVSCDGADAIRATGPYPSAVLGHPHIWLEIDERGFAECPYCGRRFVLDGEAAHAH